MLDTSDANSGTVLQLRVMALQRCPDELQGRLARRFMAAGNGMWGRSDTVYWCLHRNAGILCPALFFSKGGDDNSEPFRDYRFPNLFEQNGGHRRNQRPRKPLTPGFQKNGPANWAALKSAREYQFRKYRFRHFANFQPAITPHARGR